MITFTIPGAALPRLARLILATDPNAPGPLRHLALRITTTAARFSATNGKLLACLLLDITDLHGDLDEQGDLDESILDVGQLTAACKIIGKNCRTPVTISIEKTEARLTAGMVSSLIRRHDGTFPSIDHIWTRSAGLHWVPCTSSLDPELAATAQKIAGKSRMLFNTPVHPTDGVQRLWEAPTPDETTPALPALRNLLRATAYWADHELAILLMPITRSGAEQQLDLERFACPRTPAAAAHEVATEAVAA